MQLDDLREMQRKLQDHIRRNSGRPLLAEMDDQQRSDTIKEDVLAATDELHEALAKVGWKSWATERGILDRDAYLREIVDALFFLMNLMNAADPAPGEIDALYSEKWSRNWQRYATGTYSMIEGKCPGCGDDYGDIIARGGTYNSETGRCARCIVQGIIG